MKKLIVKKGSLHCVMIFLLAILGNKSPAQLNKTVVSPFQTGHYTPGFMNIRDYADPAPISGLMVMDNNSYQSGNKFYGKNGIQITQITGPNGTETFFDKSWRISEIEMVK
jgi:hypothetical protein